MDMANVAINLVRGKASIAPYRATNSGSIALLREAVPDHLGAVARLALDQPEQS
jgi:hypothetical protein